MMHRLIFLKVNDVYYVTLFLVDSVGSSSIEFYTTVASFSQVDDLDLSICGRRRMKMASLKQPYNQIQKTRMSLTHPNTMEKFIGVLVR